MQSTSPGTGDWYTVQKWRRHRTLYETFVRGKSLIGRAHRNVILGHDPMENIAEVRGPIKLLRPPGQYVQRFSIIGDDHPRLRERLHEELNDGGVELDILRVHPRIHFLRRRHVPHQRRDIPVDGLGGVDIVWNSW